MKHKNKFLTFSLISISTIVAILVPTIVTSCAPSQQEDKKPEASNINKSTNYQSLKTNYNSAKVIINKIKVNSDKFIQKSEAFINLLKELKTDLEEIAKSANLSEEEKQQINTYISTWLTIASAEQISANQASEYTTSLNKLEDISEDLDLVMKTHITKLNNDNNEFFQNLEVINNKLLEKNIENEQLQSSLRNIWSFFLETLVDPDHFTEEEHLHEHDINPQTSNQHNHSHAAANLYYESLEWVDDFIKIINKETNNQTNKTILINSFTNIMQLVKKADATKENDINKKFELFKYNLETLIVQDSKTIYANLDFKLQEDSKTILSNIKTNLEMLLDELKLPKNSVSFEE
ncbi:MAG5150 family histidine triad lipoprotein [Mycoplasma miroungirhinis]|uniref:Lipoprotein n=1 Tax=Mycoplasma miroungirhinis TaxID=754516 RepID=A0A6M4JEA4_9MOLU|nr:hypothetical protein [Mycoplasma miroungirhinis]QJR44406.1 hypothetical protein HLA92_03130 [Mycoplasma miroungirhinis]